MKKKILSAAIFAGMMLLAVGCQKKDTAVTETSKESAVETSIAQTESTSQTTAVTETSTMTETSTAVAQSTGAETTKEETSTAQTSKKDEKTYLLWKQEDWKKADETKQKEVAKYFLIQVTKHAAKVSNQNVSEEQIEQATSDEVVNEMRTQLDKAFSLSDKATLSDILSMSQEMYSESAGETK